MSDAPYAPPLPPVPPAPRRTGAWIALAIVAALVLPILFAGGGFVTGVVVTRALSPDPYGEEYWSEEIVTGVVLDASGAEVEGVGTAGSPASVGEHTLSFVDVDGTRLDVTVERVIWDADAILAEDPGNPPPGAGLVHVQADLRLEFSGSYPIDPWEELYISAESGAHTSDADMVRARPAHPLSAVGWMEDGEVATCSVVFELPPDAAADTVITVEPYWAYPLHVADR